MQGRNAVIQPTLNRIPRSEDLQKMLRAVQTGPAPVQQPISLENGRKFVLKLSQAKGSTGLGRTKNHNDTPLWALCEGLNTVWEYNTTDMELIFNLIEEVLYTPSAPQPGADGGNSAAALALQGEAPAASTQQFSGGAVESTGNFQNPQAVSQQFANPYANALQTSIGYQSTSSQFAAPIDQINAAYKSPQSPPSQISQSPRVSGQFAAASTSQFTTEPAPRAKPRASTSQTGMQLSGNLSELGIPDLFQSISVGKLTGRLDVSSGLESIEVFFEEGAPRRASFHSDSMTGPTREMVGDEVLLEALTWNNGFFQFNSALKSTERSPMRRLDLLLLEGATLRDYTDALEKAGFEPECAPMRLAQHTEAEFERLLSEGIPVNMQQQKALYVAFDGKATLGDVIRQANLGKPAWLPIVFNLYKCGMIGLPQKAKVAATTSDTTQSPMVREAVQEAFAELLRPDTALLSYPLFLHFAEIEFQRALNLRLPFSMVLIKVHKEGNGAVEQLSSDDLKLVAQRLRAGLESYDHVGHYQTLDIGVLLPHRAAAQARETINQFISEFDSALAATGNPVKFVWSIGLGCIPEDGIALSAMTSKAEQEKNKPREVASNIF